MNILKPISNLVRGNQVQKMWDEGKPIAEIAWTQHITVEEVYQLLQIKDSTNYSKDVRALADIVVQHMN